MTRMMKEFFMAIICAIFAIIIITTLSDCGKENFSMKDYLVTQEMVSEIKVAKTEEVEKIHTYYINVGENGYKGCHDYTAYPTYSFNTETGEWSDGGKYIVYDGDLCEINKYGERTKIGFILAVEYGDRLVYNYCH